MLDSPDWGMEFQSTLPARGATPNLAAVTPSGAISIHAPRTGSDGGAFRDVPRAAVISIHAPRTGSDAQRLRLAAGISISIHAPRTGSDARFRLLIPDGYPFQSTLPARGATTASQMRCASCKHFNPRSPHGERLVVIVISSFFGDFNPRSPHGERRGFVGFSAGKKNFNPRSPHGERRARSIARYFRRLFQSTLPARGATTVFLPNYDGSEFQSTLPARGATIQIK